MATLGVLNLNVLQQQSDKRQIIFLKDSTTKKNPNPKTMTRIHNPPPVAVARRNARERNRVKQVNNGFATLRQHIPQNIAAAYESGNGRGSNKKLSKVETLRMAVEYIKSLEKLLNISEESSTISNASSFAYSTDDDDDHSSTAKSKYQMMYEDEENIHPLKLEQMDLQSSLDDMAILSSIDHTTSLSPEVYSEQSLSPGAQDNIKYISYQLPSFSQIAYERHPQVKQEFNELDKSERVCIITRNEAVDVMWWDPQQPR